jgi:hypothetical protein
MKEQHTVTLYTDDDDEIILQPPGCFEVCWRCRGEGRHCNPAIDGNGITSSEMEELGDEFREDYLRGVYDVPCEVCGGRRVTWEIDWNRWLAVDPEHAAAYRRQLELDAECEAMSRAERMMGA